MLDRIPNESWPTVSGLAKYMNPVVASVTTKMYRKLPGPHTGKQSVKAGATLMVEGKGNNNNNKKNNDTTITNNKTSMKTITNNYNSNNKGEMDQIGQATSNLMD